MSATFVTTGTILDQILAHKTQEVAARQAARSLREVIDAARQAQPPRQMLAALRQDTVALVAEVKHASPSKGLLIKDFDPVALATIYAHYGATAISALTDERFFMGHLDHLTAIRNAVSLPLLQKDFVISDYQVYEGRAAGADAALLIAAALDDPQLVGLHSLIAGLGMSPLVEVHNEQELERTLRLGERDMPSLLIGVNNRDLQTFHVDLDTIVRLASLIPENVTLIAESGIHSAEDVCRMGEAGAHAVLVGEALVTSDDIGNLTRELSHQARHPRKLNQS
jgi:indole-3-glycerol phosphate synthase